ncbi:glycosyltransferase [Flavobacteriaceae bacterium Ap0902]|nr:glycosyltransferase [Flavobacteriaceae bacterium Ap0902]
MTNKLSALLISFNEKDNIRGYLNNFSFADEIIVVDSFSTDGTAEIIRKEFPEVKLIQRKFKNFTDQKNFTISQATHPWTIFFDADERISKELQKEIINIINKPEAKNAYYIHRQFYFLNKPLQYSAWQNDKAIRLFKTDKCSYDATKLVHETMSCSGEVGYLINKLQHFSLTSIQEYNKKLDMYADLRAEELFKKGVKPNIFHFTIKPAWRFLHHYIFGLGFLDGREGYLISKIYGQHVYKRYVLLNEKWKKSN